jgi:hypothetical protein
MDAIKKIESETSNVEVDSDMWQVASMFCQGEAAMSMAAKNASSRVLLSVK